MDCIVHYWCTVDTLQQLSCAVAGVDSCRIRRQAAAGLPGLLLGTGACPQGVHACQEVLRVGWSS
jgi:hypothetical protein